MIRNLFIPKLLTKNYFGRQIRYFSNLKSFMYVPVCNKAMLDKCHTRNADCLILDLEDSIADNRKHEAREIAQIYLQNEQNKFSDRLPIKFALRSNSLNSGYGQKDLEFCIPFFNEGNILVYPKTDTLDDIKQLDKKLSDILKNKSSLKTIKLVLIVESASCFVNLKDILEYLKQKSKVLDVFALLFGADDYLASLERSCTSYNPMLDFARHQIIQFCRAYNLLSIDMVTVDFKDLDSFKSTALDSYQLGFTSKQAIHPNQVDIINSSYRPSNEDIDWAKRLINFYDQTVLTEGKGSMTFEGKMIDHPLLLQARSILKNVSN